ncbi:MAG TPA: cation diffusion facilitator family transporter, partial [Candidatus Polarisedimenticolia bacterium]|nr:cation diffusion facilitator family transporter [Candidatus Polarisedimenticolia bacterium]
MMHQHPHAPASSQEQDRKRLLWAAGLTGVILVVEAVGGYYSHSLSLLSDSGHMMTDLLALLLSLFAVTVAARPATHHKTYGFYRLEILTALVNGTILVLVSLYLVVEAVRRILRPEAVATSLMLCVAVVGLVANLAGIALLSRSRKNLNVRAALLHVFGDTLSSLGVIGGALIMKFTHWYQADGLISLLISGVILWGAVHLMREACDILLEAAPRSVALLDLSRAIRSVEGVVDLYD